jgi:hypothetical protein
MTEHVVRVRGRRGKGLRSRAAQVRKRSLPGRLSIAHAVPTQEDRRYDHRL